MIDAHGNDISHLQRWDRIDLYQGGDDEPQRTETMSGSLIAITGACPYQEPEILIVTIKLDAGPVVEIRSDQIVEDDEAAHPDVQAELDQARDMDMRLNRPFH